MDFDTPKTAQTNGITVEFFEQGEGPAVVLLHGFPELPFSWRKQVDPIAEAGFRVIVPSQRGYAGSDAPADGYDFKTLVEDVAGLLDAVGVDDAVWIGHDSGSFIAWASPLFAADRVLGVASLCVPYLPPEKDHDLVELMVAARGPKTYFNAVQEPGPAEAFLESDVEHLFRALMRGRGYTMDEFQAAPPEVRELPLEILAGEPQLFGEPIVSEEELAYYVKTFERTGFRGALGHYRELHKDWELSKDLDPVVDKPALMINAADDFYIPPGMTAGMGDVLPQLEEHTIPDVAHWVAQEKPEEVNAIVIPWLQRNFA